MLSRQFYTPTQLKADRWILLPPALLIFAGMILSIIEHSADATLFIMLSGIILLVSARTRGLERRIETLEREVQNLTSPPKS